MATNPKIAVMVVCRRDRLKAEVSVDFGISYPSEKKLPSIFMRLDGAI